MKNILVTFAIALMLCNMDAFASTTISWIAPMEREDNTSLAYDEIESYTIHQGREPGNLPNSTSIPRPVNIQDSNYTFTDLEMGINYFAITTRDTGGRESARSLEVSKREDEGIVIKKPTYPEFSMIRVGNTFDYVLTFSEVTKYEDGTDMPIPAYKYYLFNNGVWETNVFYSELPRTFTWTKGIQKFQMEAEIQTSTSNISSERSPELIIDVQDVIVEPPVILPPKAPVIIDIPEEGVVINQSVLITPVQ